MSAAPQDGSNTSAALMEPAADSERVLFAEVIVQRSKASVAAMSFEDLTACRIRYERTAGVAPPDELLPSGEQLAVLRVLITMSKVPFADFAVWGALGPRLAKFPRTEGQVCPRT